MGLTFSSTQRETPGKKRKPVDNTLNDIPFKKHITSTYKHVYKELFLNGEGSDIKVHALGKKWNLHRIFIFQAMFNGNWKEKDSDSIELKICDPYITTDALDILFGSFYSDYINITVKNVINVSAAASWFNLEEIRNTCESFMVSELRASTLNDFYDAADRYEMKDLKCSCIRWLSRRIVILENNEKSFNLLKNISIDLMEKVISNPNTIVVSMEQDLFLNLMKWMYLKINSNIEFSLNEDLFEKSFQFFNNEKPNFLLSPEGKDYAQIFKKIRLENIINTHKSANQMIRDEILPLNWVIKAFCTQWIRVLNIHEKHQAEQTNSSSGEQNSFFSDALDELPSRPVDTNFWTFSERCGRNIEIEDSVISWKWDCYHFGCDFIIKYRRRVFTIIKYNSSSTRSMMNSFPSNMKISMRVISREVLTNEDFDLANYAPESNSRYQFIDSSMNNNVDQGFHNVEDNLINFSKDFSIPQSQSRYFFASTQPLVKKINLEEQSSHEILRLPENFHFPIVISANILRSELRFKTEREIILIQICSVLCLYRYDPVSMETRIFETF